MLDLEVRPTAATCLSRLRRSPARSRPCSTPSLRRRRASCRRPPASRPTSDLIRVGIDDFDRCLRFTARALRRRPAGGLAAAHPPAHRGRRHAPDLERRRHHQLRDAGHRQPDARLRRRSKIAGGELTARLARAGRAHRHARRQGAHADARHAGDRRRATARTGWPASWAARPRRSATATQTVVLEAANFERYGMRARARRWRCAPTARGRWIRGVDPRSGAAGIRAGPPSCWSSWPARRCCPGSGRGRRAAGSASASCCAHGFAEQILGLPISDDGGDAHPARASASSPSPSTDPSGVAVTVPTWRLDGHDAARSTSSRRSAASTAWSGCRRRCRGRTDSGGELTRAQAVRRRVEDALAGAGLQEAVHALAGATATSPTCYGLADDDPRRQLVRAAEPALGRPRATCAGCWCRACCAPCAATARSAAPTSALFEIAHLLPRRRRRRLDRGAGARAVDASGWCCPAGSAASRWARRRSRVRRLHGEGRARDALHAGSA